MKIGVYSFPEGKEPKDLEVKIESLSKQNIKLCKQTENAEEILSQHEAYISLLENKNQQLKELIREIRSLWKGTVCMPDSQEQVRDILTKIDNAIGEKK